MPPSGRSRNQSKTPSSKSKPIARTAPSAAVAAAATLPSSTNSGGAFIMAKLSSSKSKSVVSTATKHNGRIVGGTSTGATTSGGVKLTSPVPTTATTGSNNNNNTGPTNASSTNSMLNGLDKETKEAFEDALEDVHTRFILNLPNEELATSDRIFFQIEQAWWFYEDFVCDDMDNKDGSTTDTKTTTITTTTTTISLPRFKQLKPFARTMFEISPLLPVQQFDAMWNEFSQYRRKISTYGTILLNKSCTKVVLCQDYNGKSWTFPAGKVNQNETGFDASVRETYEETGFDINCQLGRTKEMKEANDGQGITWKPLREEDKLVYVESDVGGDKNGKRRTCYVCWGVPESFPFEPVVRKEVSAVDWFEISSLPKKSFAVLPFIQQLKRWIKKNVKGGAAIVSSLNNASSKKSKERGGGRDSSRKKNDQNGSNTAGTETHQFKVKQALTPEKKRSGSNKKDRRSNSNKRDKTNSRPKSRTGVNGKDRKGLIESGLVQAGEKNHWDEEEMFRANEQLIGRKIEYDGNPQLFATKGFDGKDPHAFHVVGGGFMNSGVHNIANAPDKSKLQPLFRTEGSISGITDEPDASDSFKPFFSNDGATPWGEVVTDLSGAVPGKSNTNINSFEHETTFGPSIIDQSPSNNSMNLQSIGIERKTNKSAGLAILNMLRRGSIGSENEEVEEPKNIIPAATPATTPVATATTILPSKPPSAYDSIFQTDKEITEKSQKEKLRLHENQSSEGKDVSEEATKTSSLPNQEEIEHGNSQPTERDKAGISKSSKHQSDGSHGGNRTIAENVHFKYLCDWAKKLPNAPASKHFGDFHFDVDAIINAMKTTQTRSQSKA